MDRATLLTLSRDDLIALVEAQAQQIVVLIEAQAQQIAALTVRISELEGRLAAPPKTPDNSSLPPSKGQKPNLPDPGKKTPRPGRAGCLLTTIPGIGPLNATALAAAIGNARTFQRPVSHRRSSNGVTTRNAVSLFNAGGPGATLALNASTPLRPKSLHHS